MTENAAPQTSRLSRIFHDAATSPALAFSAGNVIWSAVTAGEAGLIFNAAVLALVTGIQVHNTLRPEKKIPDPLFVTSGVHAVSACLTMGTGAQQLGLSALFNVLGNRDARRFVFTAAARAGWACAHFIRGWQNQFGKAPRFMGSQPFHAGYADIFMTAADTVKALNVPALALVGAGLAKTLSGGPAPENISTPRAFISKHVTPNRLYATTFLLGAAQAENWPYAAAQALWGYGYGLFDSKENKSLAADIRALKI